MTTLLSYGKRCPAKGRVMSALVRTVLTATALLFTQNSLNDLNVKFLAPHAEQVALLLPVQIMASQNISTVILGYVNELVN